MTTRAVADFILQANENPDLRAKFEGRTADERITSVVAVAAEHGFEFTAAECREFLDAARAVGRGELGEKQLEQVAAGGTGGLELMIGTILRGYSDALKWAFGDDDSETAPTAAP